MFQLQNFLTCVTDKVKKLDSCTKKCDQISVLPKIDPILHYLPTKMCQFNIENL